jgi:hypothetical protein
MILNEFKLKPVNLVKRSVILPSTKFRSNIFARSLKDMQIQNKRINYWQRRKAVALENSDSDCSSISGSASMLKRKYHNRRKPTNSLFYRS